MTKPDLRARVLAARDATDPEWRILASAAIAASVSLEPGFKHATRIALFATIGSEVETSPIARLSKKKEIAWPRVENGVLTFHLAKREDLVPLGKWQIPTPSPNAPLVQPASIELFVVPGVAFDRTRHRLGYGAGYYDRALTGTKALKVGIAFDLQIVDSVPVLGHDVAMDVVVTESRII
jgi:5-formyltetrahydrofolate cyclo-ligase